MFTINIQNFSIMPQHIRRLILVFAIFILLFLIVQHLLKPNSFGELGHYRAKAIHENTLRELHYGGSDICSKCHDSIRIEKSEGFHAKLKCEVCHGPGLKHALYADKFKNGHLPDSLVLYKPVERKNCAICHQINAARIKIAFDTIDNTLIRQVDVMKHKLLDKKTKQEQKCIKCHNPHQP
jgi:hypothetical protein